MAWVYIIIAGFFEVAWAVGLKYTDGFSKLGPSLGTAAAMIISFYMLSLGLKTLPIGTAYAVWTGIGAVGTVIFGMFVLGESKDLGRIICIILIVSGILGLKLFTK